MTGTLDVLKEEFIAFLNIEIKKCQKVLQEYIDENVRESNVHFRKFFAEHINVITKETEKCLDKIKQAKDAKSCDKQLTFFDQSNIFLDNETQPLTTKEKKALRTLQKTEERRKLFELAKEKLPDMCTKESIIKFKLSHNKEIREDILKNKLHVYQSYGESKKAAFLLFKKEDVLNWVSKKWGL